MLNGRLLCPPRTPCVARVRERRRCDSHHVGKMFFLAACLGFTAGFVQPPRVVASGLRSSTSARTEGIELIGIGSKETLSALAGLIVITVGLNQETVRSNNVKAFQDVAKGYQRNFVETVFFGSAAFLTSVFELPYTAKEDVVLRVTCAVVVAAAITYATDVASKADKNTVAADMLEKNNEKFIPFLASITTVVLPLLLAAIDGLDGKKATLELEALRLLVDKLSQP